MGREPSAGVFLRKGLQGPLHHAFSTGVGFAEGAYSGKSIAQIAPSAARDGHFGEGLGTGLKQRYTGAPAEQLRSAETAGGPGTDNGHARHLAEFPFFS